MGTGRRHYRWIVITAALLPAACAIPGPTPDEFRTQVQGDPGSPFLKTETFSVAKPFSQVMAAVGPQFERCFTYVSAAMPAQQVLPSQRQGTVTAKGQGKAELVYTHSGCVNALVDIEAAGASTKITVMGAYTAPLERGIRSWISGGTSCPVALETPLGIY